LVLVIMVCSPLPRFELTGLQSVASDHVDRWGYATARWTQLNAADVRDYGALIVGPLITLVASVVGFYFGERRRG